MKSQHFGFTQGAFSIGMVLMSAYFSIRKEVQYPFLLSKRGILVMATCMGAISVPLLINLSYWGVFIYFIVLMLVNGSMVIVVNTPLQVMLQKMIADEYKGRVFSIIETMAMALMPLGMVIYGFLFDLFPGQWILLLSATVLILVVLVMARPSVIRKMYPELGADKEVKGKVGVVS